MAIDYRPKKNVTRNRPRKRPIKTIALMILGGIVTVYGLGVATGWLIFKYFPEPPPEMTAGMAPPDGARQPLPPVPPPGTTKKTPGNPDNDPDLTFYYTLPKGEKGVIGSGINMLPPTAPVNAPPAPVQPVDKQPQPVKTVEVKGISPSPAAAGEKKAVSPAEQQTVSKNKNPEKETFTVQVAAFHEKNEACTLKDKLRAGGVTARIEEYTVKGEDTWFRVRTGRKLDRDAAARLAAKIGGNAILVPD